MTQRQQILPDYPTEGYRSRSFVVGAGQRVLVEEHLDRAGLWSFFVPGYTSFQAFSLGPISRHGVLLHSATRRLEVNRGEGTFRVHADLTVDFEVNA